MRDVHEREADLGLDPLELELHLAAELEVERAERLVEEQERRAVDQRAGEGDPLLLPAGELGRLAVGQVPQLDQVEPVGHPRGDVASPASACSPNATFSPTVRCGNSA